MRKIDFLALSLLALVACKPDVDAKISTEDIVQSATTEAPMTTEFDARIEKKYTTLDDKKRVDVKTIAGIIEKYFEDAEVDLAYSGNGF